MVLVANGGPLPAKSTKKMYEISNMSEYFGLLLYPQISFNFFLYLQPCKGAPTVRFVYANIYLVDISSKQDANVEHVLLRMPFWPKVLSTKMFPTKIRQGFNGLLYSTILYYFQVRF